MTRKKVPLQFIASDSSRKVTFKKRKKGLIKKVSELSTLCGIEACAIVYGPFSNEPEVWPSPAEARRTIARFRNMSEMDRSKGMVNQQGFLRQRIGKAEMQLKKQQRDNHEKEVTQVMYQTLAAPPTALIGLNLSDLNELDSSVGKTLHDVEERIRLLKKKPSSQQQLPHQQPHQQQLGNDDFRPQLGSEGRVRVPEMEGQGGGGGGGGFNFETVVMEQPPVPPPPQQWYMDLLKPTDQLYGGAGGSGGLGFANNKNNEDANNNSAMMMMMPSSSSSSSMAMQMPNTTNQNASSSSWPNFLYH